MIVLRRYWPELIGIILAVAIIALTACGSCPKCPVAIPPPPVTVIAPSPPCMLPDLPAPIAGLGVPDAQRDGYFVPRQSWALLGGYVSGLREWIQAAASCLTRGQP